MINNIFSATSAGSAVKHAPVLFSRRYRPVIYLDIVNQAGPETAGLKILAAANAPHSYTQRLFSSSQRAAKTAKSLWSTTPSP